MALASHLYYRTLIVYGHLSVAVVVAVTLPTTDRPPVCEP